jgi:hypothetical protein
MCVTSYFDGDAQLCSELYPAAVLCVVLLQVFLQRSAVNLLGVVLDVPEFFWSAPDHLQVRVCPAWVSACTKGCWSDRWGIGLGSKLRARFGMKACDAPDKAWLLASPVRGAVLWVDASWLTLRVCAPASVLAQVLYKRVCEYLELDTRVEVLNTRWVQ